MKQELVNLKIASMIEHMKKMCSSYMHVLKGNKENFKNI